MKIEEHKPTIFLVSIIISILIGVISWYLLEQMNVFSSIEIATLLTLSLINILVIYFLHGKGLLPIPPGEENENVFALHKCGCIIYSRRKFNPFQVKKIFYKAYHRKNYSNQMEVRSILEKKYTRKKFRN